MTASKRAATENPMKDHPHWKRMQFKGNKVWQAVDDQARPLLQKGKTLIKYQQDQPHEYWVSPSSVLPLDAASPPPQPRSSRTAKTKEHQENDDAITPEACAGAICIYTDGACSGNPGPAGIGVVLRYKEKCKEIARHIGNATNNIAELEAIKAGLQAVRNRDLPVIVFTDSSYALGLLSKGWKAKQNMALVEEIRRLVQSFPRLRFIKVKGHAGHPDNERADRLAVQAIQGPG
jgi:ribonuclease HI